MGGKKSTEDIIWDKLKEGDRLIVLMVFVVIIVSMVWFIYFIFSHNLIESAYYGKSFGALNQVIRAQDTYSLQHYLTASDQLFYEISIDFFVITIFSLILYSMLFLKIDVSHANRFFFFLISSTLLLAMVFLLAPKLYGDGDEYYLMTQSFYHHLSPDAQYQDVAALEEMGVKFLYPSPGLTTGYHTADNNKTYSSHFWGYSLFNIPVKFFLRAINLDELKVFQVTNSFLLILVLFHIIFLSDLSDLKKLLFSFFSVFGPAFWFIHWTTPEIFMYSFVIMALVYLNKRKYHRSVLCASIASMQNPSIIMFAVFLWVKGFMSAREKVEKSIILSTGLIPSAIPIIFYHSLFGSLTILATKLDNISLYRVWEMFFDLNIGLLPYIPLALIIFLAIIARDLLIKRKITLSVQLFLLLIIMMLFCTSTPDFNQGTSGPSKYVIWMLPLIYYVIVIQQDFSTVKRLNESRYLTLLLIAVLIQSLIIFYGGGIIPRVNYLDHTILAKFVLNHFPILYNPDKEIFIERTLANGYDDSFTSDVPHCSAAVNKQECELENPVVYFYKDKCRKALITGKNGGDLVSICGYFPERYKKFQLRCNPCVSKDFMVLMYRSMLCVIAVRSVSLTCVQYVLVVSVSPYLRLTVLLLVSFIERWL